MIINRWTHSFFEGIKIKETDFIVIIICALQICAFAQADNTLYNEQIGFLYKPIMLLLTLYLLFRQTEFSITFKTILLVIAVLTNFLLCYIHAYEMASIFSILETITIIVICCRKSRCLISSYLLLKYCFVLMSFFGVISYICYTTSIIPPFSSINFYTDDNGYTLYQIYFLSHIVTSPLSLPRLCGLFNEPGMFGTFGALLLISDKCRMSKENIVIAIASILTFSMAFFMLIAIYMIFKMIVERKVSNAIVVSCALGLFVYLSNLQYDDPALELFFNRFKIEDGVFVGDNRENNDLIIYWNTITKDSQKLWYGYGSLIKFEGTSSIKTYIIFHGIIGLLLVFIPLLIGSLLRCKNKYSICFVIVYFLSLYQRPQIFFAIFFLILIGGIEYCNIDNGNVVQDKLSNKRRLYERGIFNSNIHV